MPKWSSLRPLALILAVFALLILIVDPLREMLTQDDSWAYARTVKHLIETGEYRLDSWAAANMPVQVYFAALLARIFGYSLTLLRLSTLLMFLAGAIAFHRLVYESESDRALAAALAVALICSPLALLLGFTFMTDVHFLGWVLIACWLYARGLRRESTLAVFLGGLAAALAVGTRQFGVALPVGLAFGWLLARRDRRPRLSAILAGVAPPCAAFLIQLYAATLNPTFTQSVRLVEETQYVHLPKASLLFEVAWRITVLAEYSGLFLAGLVPALLLFYYRQRTSKPPALSRQDGRSYWRVRLPFAVFAACVLLGLLGGASGGPGAVRDSLKLTLMPSIPWILSGAVPNQMRYALILTVAAIAATLLIGGFVLDPPALKKLWSRRDSPLCFMLGTCCAFAALHLFYVQFNDTYLIVFVPFALFLIARLLRLRAASRQCIHAIALGSAVVGISVAVWMRGDYNWQETLWGASDKIHARGVDPMQIRGDLFWSAYHSAFDRWLAEIGPSARPEDYAGPYRLYLAFTGSLAEAQKEAEYWLWLSDLPPELEGYYVSERLPYTGRLFRKHFVYVMRRKPQPDSAARD